MIKRLTTKFDPNDFKFAFNGVVSRRAAWFFVLIAICFLLSSLSAFAAALQKNRLIVLTDIGADPDDTMSMVRLLLYSDEIDIEGLIATTSCWKQKSVSPELIRRVIEAYGKVQPNLDRNEPGFPTADFLLQKLKSGLPQYGLLGVGEGADSAGSDWIIKVLEENDDRPVWVTAWGGVNTLAQALFEIKKTMTRAGADRLIAKLRVYTISDQDDSGIWIRTNFPNLFYIVSPGDDYGSATWNAINTVVDGIDNGKISNRWLAENIQQNHGPLGAVYPDVAYGMEGDTPSWLNLIPNGLSDPDHPDWGGWGGRYEFYKPDFASTRKGGSGVPHEPETRAIWTDAVDNYTPDVSSEFGRAMKPSDKTFRDNKVTLWRWRDDFQNDFAARMNWCIRSYRECNHPPVPALRGPEKITVGSGQGFVLDASGTTDPDGDSLSFLWFNYPEAGSYHQRIKIESAENMRAVWVIAPEVQKSETAHFILKVTDKGTPPLTRYERVIVTILPKQKI
ncbi:MAG TPA: nucleoside hydrolase-like domain-containing protein [Verrucomicrobiae bacterium]|nr:nucleoside hydrolase-like domain-containing protein [Verrucomicrobiae bacterium]